ncbi:GSCOCG00012974001-RA-CDS [Cotesia congregata]|nr:GSCOCG00012974001-RA-CDS [Cotesia congregata]
MIASPCFIDFIIFSASAKLIIFGRSPCVVFISEVAAFTGALTAETVHVNFSNTTHYCLSYLHSILRILDTLIRYIFHMNVSRQPLYQDMNLHQNDSKHLQAPENRSLYKTDIPRAQFHHFSQDLSDPFVQCRVF